MLQVQPDFVQFQGDRAAITIINNTGESYTVKLKCSNTTAYKYDMGEFVVNSKSTQKKEISIDIPRQVDINDCFYVLYKQNKHSDPRSAREGEIILKVLRLDSGQLLAKEYSKLQVEQQLFHLENYQMQLQHDKTKMQQTYLDFQQQYRELSKERKQLESDLHLAQKQLKVAMSENILVKLQNTASIQNLALLLVLFVVSFLLVVKW